MFSSHISWSQCAASSMWLDLFYLSFMVYLTSSLFQEKKTFSIYLNLLWFHFSFSFSTIPGSTLLILLFVTEIFSDDVLCLLALKTEPTTSLFWVVFHSVSCGKLEHEIILVCCDDHLKNSVQISECIPCNKGNYYYRKLSFHTCVCIWY